MSGKRVEKLNALLRKVIDEVMRREVRNPHVSPLTSITRVDTARDLRRATVHISVIGKHKEREATLRALSTSSSYISTIASKKVSLRYFPSLTFALDTTVDKQMQIDRLIEEIQKKSEEHESARGDFTHQ